MQTQLDERSSNKVFRQTTATSKCGANRPNFDLGELHMSIRIGSPEILGFALRAPGAWPPSHTWRRLGLIQGVSRVQPEHAHIRVVPKRKHQHDAAVQSLTHCRQASLELEV